MSVVYRVVGFSTKEMSELLVFDHGTLSELLERFPISSYPGPLSGTMEEIRWGREGSMIFRLLEGQSEGGEQPKSWVPVKKDPRLSIPPQ